MVSYHFDTYDSMAIAIGYPKGGYPGTRRGKEQTMDQTAWDERYAGPELVWGAGPNCFVAAELAGLRPGRAIDLGTGEGRNAIWLAERGW